jgi:AbrB family looped-hinge helix DNA binding protein
MTKVLQSTSRGQVTIPKSWRDKFDTSYYIVEIKSDELVLRPMVKGKAFKDAVEGAWKEYKNGDFTDGDALMAKYGL